MRGRIRFTESLNNFIIGYKGLMHNNYTTLRGFLDPLVSILYLMFVAYGTELVVFEEANDATESEQACILAKTGINKFFPVSR